MKRKIFSIFLTLVLVLTLGLVTAVPVAAQDGTTYYVAIDGSDDTGDGSESSPWATIQYAIDEDVLDGDDTILVYPGAYVIDEPAIDEACIIIDVEGLTVKALHPAADLVNPLDPDLASSIVPDDGVKVVDVINIAATGVTFDGFTVIGAECGVDIYDWYDELEYSGCFITNNYITGSGDGICVEGPGHTISGNIITDNEDAGIYIVDSEVITISGNTFRNNGVQLMAYAGFPDIQLVLDDNDFDRAVTVDHDGASLLPTIWSSIQDAIDDWDTDAGDTVIVAAGTYTEQLTIDEAVTLDGANAGINAVTGTRGDESIIDVSGYTTGNGVTITASDVTIDGFEIIGIPYLGDGSSNVNPTIAAETGAEYVTVQNCVFNSEVLGKEAMLARPGTNHISFLDNEVNNYMFGITARGDGWGDATPDVGVTYLTVSGNTFNVGYVDTGTQITGEAVQIHYGDDIVVTGNTINGPGTFESCAYGLINSIGIVDFMSGYGAAGTITYSNNEVTNCYVGIATFAGNGEISGNIVTGNNIGIQVGQESDVYITTPAEGVAITGNDIQNNIRGIWAQNFVVDGLAAHFNNIVGNTDYGVINEDPENDEFDATNNWWGDATPVFGTIVSSDVDFSPWLGAPAGTTPMTWHTNDSIQDAINAATSGDTILVAPGTYAESVTIDKDNLTIAGDVSQPSITGGLKFDTNLTGLNLVNFYVTGNAVAGKNSIVRMYGAITGLAVHNCVFDGENVVDRMGFTGGELEGDVSITGSEFKNILGWPVLDSRSGSGGDGSAMGTVTFAINNVHDCNGTVVFRGLSDDWTDKVYIYGNTFETIGEAEVSGHWAAFEVNRANNVEIHDNQIRNVVENLGGEGQAMQLWQIGTADIYGNTIEDNYQGIAILNWPTGESYDISNISIHNNSFSGNDQYALSVEDDLTGGPLDATNNWWGNASGPYHMTNLDGTGDLVSDNVEFDPWSTQPDFTGSASQVGFTADVSDVIAISVFPIITIDFGSVIPGVDASGDIITIANTGNVPINLDTLLSGVDTFFYTEYLFLMLQRRQ